MSSTGRTLRSIGVEFKLQHKDRFLQSLADVDDQISETVRKIGEIRLPDMGGRAPPPIDPGTQTGERQDGMAQGSTVIDDLHRLRITSDDELQKRAELFEHIGRVSTDVSGITAGVIATLGETKIIRRTLRRCCENIAQIAESTASIPTMVSRAMGSVGVPSGGAGGAIGGGIGRLADPAVFAEEISRSISGEARRLGDIRRPATGLMRDIRLVERAIQLLRREGRTGTPAAQYIERGVQQTVSARSIREEVAMAASSGLAGALRDVMGIAERRGGVTRAERPDLTISREGEPTVGIRPPGGGFLGLTGREASRAFDTMILWLEKIAEALNSVLRAEDMAPGIRGLSALGDPLGEGQPTAGGDTQPVGRRGREFFGLLPYTPPGGP